MDTNKITDKLNRFGKSRISNQTVLDTYEKVDSSKFFTQGVNNRDNARWERAQYLIVTDCPTSMIDRCVQGFKQFAFPNQFLIFPLADIVYDGWGKKLFIDDFFNTLK